ncbi:hypothetical protein BGZ65_012529 [Modicella reniformis]|uniref:Vacuolar ATPase assembly protein VMA22 n=1 Tax=Modicella reniformis TaxID=1440133 RepID=A0A9P6M196_9FUNG|nr:hypothetical protein BGZ65_012529 [Modicella reniformis]
MSRPDSKVCQDLDDLVIQYLALIDDHLAVWNRISDRFQQGRELISQTKYIMGPRNVSADCYDHRMKALRGVMVNSPKEIVLRDLWAELKRSAAMEEGTMEDGKSTGEIGHGTGVEIMEDYSSAQNGHCGLRRRGRALSGGMGSGSTGSLSSNDEDTLVEDDKYKKMSTKTATAFTDTMAVVPESTTLTTTTGTGTMISTGTSTKKKKKKERNLDPLLWFGVIVPASLRNAQSVFQKGLQDVIEMAILRQKLFELEESIKALQLAKEEGLQKEEEEEEEDSRQ